MTKDDNRRLRAYTLAVSADARQDTGRTTDGSASTKRRRRAPTPQETERRRANRAADNAEWKAMKANGRWK